jgi:undecaprenyl-diphosphatase
MNWIYALLLGTVQALTEFLPVSSSGHLVVFQEALRIPEASHAFDALLHLGTALATIVFYRQRIWEIILGSWRWTLNFIRRAGPADQASRDAIELAALIVLCTVITGALAMPLKDVF